MVKANKLQPKIQKKLTDEVVGFSSTEKRPCLKDAKSAPDRVYDDLNAMAKAISRKTVGRNGVFGTTEQRFQRGPFASPKKNTARQVLAPTMKTAQKCSRLSGYSPRHPFAPAYVVSGDMPSTLERP